MNKLAFIVVFCTGIAFAQETALNGFIGLHYTGLTYQTAKTDPEGWNSGFGAMVGLRPSKVFSLELDYKLTPIREMYRHSPDHYIVYNSPAQLFSLNFGLGWQREKVDLRFLFGPGFRWTGKIDRTYFHPVYPTEESDNGEGRFSPAFNFGMRGMYHIAANFSASLALYGNFRFPDEETVTHFGEVEPYPLNSAALIYLDAGIAYRFTVH